VSDAATGGSGAAEQKKSRALGALPILALMISFAAMRWFAMSTAAPYRAVLPDAWMRGSALGLTRLAINAVACVLFLVVLPGCVVRLRDREEGWWSATVSRVVRTGSPPGGGWWWPIGPLVSIAVGVGAAQAIPSICSAYPIYRDACLGLGRRTLVAEGAYAVILLATELYYRGALLVAMRSMIGGWALPAMAMICAMDHAGAPAAEWVTSGVGAWVLGWIALRSRSIWPGYALHLGLAWGADAGCCAAVFWPGTG